MDEKKTGTTTVGLLCKDCVVLASESKATMGYLVAAKETKKIYQLDDKIAVTIAGSAADNQALVRIMKAEINLYKLTRNTELTVKAASTLLSNILQGSRYYPYLSVMIIGGADKNGLHLYSTDPIGSIEEEKNFTSTGSGSPMAFGVLEDGFREALSQEEGVNLAVRAIKAARERDVFSGGKNINVVVIDKDGVKFVDREKITEIAK